MDLPVDLDALRTVLREHGVAFAFVFGSRARGDHRVDSDVDLAVWSPQPVDQWTLRAALAEEIDLLDLRTAPEFIAGRVSLEGMVVYDADPASRIAWLADTRKRYLDESFRRDRFRRTFVAAHGRP